MNLYKRIFKYFKNVEGFQDLSDEQAINFIYLEKQKCIPVYVLSFFIEPKRILKIAEIFILIFVAEFAAIIPLYAFKLAINPIIVNHNYYSLFLSYMFIICAY